MSPTVSVLCPLYEHAAFVGDALASARAQTRPARDIMVIDDGSRDGSATVAESVPGVRVIRAPHRGVAATRNALVALATGELVAWLDADDVWTPDKLAVQVAFMHANPDIGVTFTHQRLRVEPGVMRPRWVTEAMIAGPTPAVATCSMVVRRALFETIGGFDPTLSRGEDTDWLMRATAAGVRHVTLPEALLVRRVHGANLSHGTPPWSEHVLGLLHKQITRTRAARSTDAVPDAAAQRKGS